MGKPNPQYTIPERQPAVLRRQRLLDSLYEKIDLPLQLICAPAGYGKTTLLADFAADADLAICWYSVADLDADPRSFLRHLTGAIRSRFPAFGNSIEPPNGSFDERQWRDTVVRMISEIRNSIAEYFVLVIDDFHIAGGHPGVADVMNTLITQTPENCHLFVSTRETPQLQSLPRLVARRKVSGLGTGDLRFTAREIEDLLRDNFNLKITAEDAQTLEEQSEGWITSILLTHDPLWHELLRDVLSHRRHGGLLFDYMAAEVFSHQSPEIQRFLLSTSICNEFDADLGNSLTGSTDSARILEEMESKILFMVRLGGDGPWYRYHHLFREFLRETLRKQDPSGLSALNVAAAKHFLSAGDRRQAIQHYLQASEFEVAMALLEAESEQLSNEGLWDTLGNWLELIPADTRAARPGLLLHLSRAYQIWGRNDDAIELLNQAIQTFNEQGEHLMEAQALMHRSDSLRFKAAHRSAIRDGKKALALVREHGSTADRAKARYHLGSAYAQQGKFSSAATQFKAALRGFQVEGNLFQLSQIHGRLGTIYSQLGDSARSAAFFELARQGWQKIGNQSELGVTLNNMANLYYQQGHFEAAEPLASESIALAKRASSPRDEAYATMTLAEIQMEQSKYAEALTSCERGLELAKECMETDLVATGLITMGETYRLLGEREKATSQIRQAVALANETGQTFEVGLGLISLGIIEYESRQYETSRASLEKACELLARSRQLRFLAKARLHLGQALFLSKSYGEALVQMDLLSDHCAELGYDRFLVPDGRGVFQLIQLAAARSKNSEFFERLTGQIDQIPLNVSDLRDLTGLAPADRPARVASTLKVCTLGTMSVTLDGSVIANTAWGSSKAREMLLFMLYKREPLHKEKIVESLWPEISSSKANSNFHSTLYRLRSALYPNCVDRDGEVYQLNPAWNFWFDIEEFEHLLSEADRMHEGDPSKESLLASATDLYRGAFASDLDSEWCDRLRTSLEFRFLDASSWLATEREARGDFQGAIDLLERHLAVDEFKEEVYYRMMDLYLKLGAKASATLTYRRYASAFDRSDAVDSPRLIQLLDRLG